MKSKSVEKTRTPYIICINILFVGVLVAIFLIYNNVYRQKLHEQNLNDISNINQSAANISSSFFSSQKERLTDIVKYSQLHQLNYEETLQYIADSNGDENRYFQLIGADYTGNLALRGADGKFIGVKYVSSNYSDLKAIIAVGKYNTGTHYISCTPEFTDCYTACKSFAVYTYLNVKDENGDDRVYTLLSVSKSSDFIDIINVEGGYKGLSSVIVNQRGDYILSNANFKSKNFFHYVYVFNDLSLDEKILLSENMLAAPHGIWQYKDYTGKDCVFTYTRIPDSDNWYCISSVPVSSFHINNLDIRFTTMIVVTLLVLMVIDLFWLAGLNYKLKSSVQKEKIASAAKSDFLSRMSHDIRTPLNVIIGMAIMAQQEENTEKTGECLHNIDEAGKFLLGLVNDILDLNKVESGKMELRLAPYSYSEFRSHIDAVILPLCCSKGICFTITADTTLVPLMLDRLRINQIVFNLLSNAVKFTPEGGHIELVCTNEKLENGKYSLCFAVKDDGIGMSQDFQNHIFEAFTQESRVETESVSGTGLGLAIVKNLVDLMGGAIALTSAENLGTTFEVYLEAEEAATLPTVEDVFTNDTILQGKRILLCEDHPLNATIAANLLERKGMVTTHAANGKIGLELFAASEIGYFDAILMDIRMPEMSGLEATAAIRSLSRADAARIPIVAMTANAYDVDIQSSFVAGMNYHLAKPIDSDLLYRILSDQIQKSKKA